MMEFLRWCEDLNMEPVLGVYAGYSLRGDHIDAGPDLAPYVQDALDEIEFVNGASSTKWGAVRAQLGHPEPFNLPYVEIGNEDNFDRSGSYEGRFAQFFDAIKAKYPNIQLIATAPVQSRHADILDYHLYSGSKDMISRFRQYDDANRATQKIFVGEWATTKDGYPTPDMNAAIGDAVWLLGLERNSDITVMEAYAPLLVNADRDSGPWGLIGFDGLTAFGSPSYWVQSVFAANEGNVVVGSQITGISGLFENVTLDQKTHTLYIKVVNAKGFEQAAPINIMGASAASIKASITTISSTDLQAVNSAADPNSVAPKTTELSVKLPQFTYAFPADSATVIKLILP
jgi:alpha-N-arabinofuranosidase